MTRWARLGNRRAQRRGGTFNIVATFAPQPDRGWDAVPVLDNLSAHEVTGSSDDGPTFTWNGRHYFALPENGWGAIVGWSMGIDNMVRIPDRQEHVTREIITDREGNTSSRSRPRTAAEQDNIDDDIDAYANAAGVPARPRGYRWFAALPHATTPDGVWEAINVELTRRGNPTHPAEIASVVQHAVAGW
jgi:hypothetical protein